VIIKRENIIFLTENLITLHGGYARRNAGGAEVPPYV
jgi:hypothetical protein